MTRGQIFPSLLIVLDLGAAAVLAVEADWRRATYWIAAAILTATVTF
jgi:5-enolpyruvylshikimate-3-phosphate synthase